MGELGLTQQSQSGTESFHFFHLLFFTLTKYQISSYDITPSETWANGLSVGILLNIKLFELFKLLYKKTTFIIHNAIMVHSIFYWTELDRNNGERC